MTSHLDELAKGMASGMSRRRALKLFGTGLLGSAAAVVLPSAATAAKGRNDACAQFCNSVFGAGTSQVRAQFEERAAFAVAPTSIYGLAARYDLGTVGEVDLTGLFQREQSAFTRPPLGLEPSASFIGGLSTRLNFQPGWLTRAVDALPGVHTEAPSFLNVAGEVAVSKPSPNPLGQAYVEEFEAEGGRFITHIARPCQNPPRLADRCGQGMRSRLTAGPIIARAAGRIVSA